MRREILVRDVISNNFPGNNIWQSIEPSMIKLFVYKLKCKSRYQISLKWWHFKIIHNLFSLFLNDEIWCIRRWIENNLSMNRGWYCNAPQNHICTFVRNILSHVGKEMLLSLLEKVWLFISNAYSTNIFLRLEWYAYIIY